MTPNGADGGADVIATPQGATGPVLIVQCKHRSGGTNAKIDDTVIDELLAARSRYVLRTPTKLLAVTNAAFTLAAQMAAEEKGVMLVDRSQLDGFPQATLGMAKGPDALSPRSGSSKQADSLML